MNSSFLLVTLAIGAIYFGLQVVRVLPALLRLLIALRSGAVKWPGPTIHEIDPRVSQGVQRLGWPSEHLFGTFTWHSLVVLAGMVYSALSFVGFSQSLIDIRDEKAWFCNAIVPTIIVFVSAQLSARRAPAHAARVNSLLSDLASGAEPRGVDGQSAEARYPVEHPVIGPQGPGPDKALSLYLDSLSCLNAGNRQGAQELYDEALRIDSRLHERARDALVGRAQGSTTLDTGPIEYWSGIHSECLGDLQRAATSYERAADAFAAIGHKNREGRARCNLGTVQLKLRNGNRAMEEFERAVALNPMDGIAHFNIGMLYYTSKDSDDPEYQRALEAFANAIVADPEVYGPVVAGRMRAHAYTWKEDLGEVMRRVEEKLR